MANKKKAKSKVTKVSTTPDSANVTRIKASDSEPAKKSVAKEVIKSVVTKKTTSETPAKTSDTQKRKFSVKSALKTSAKPAKATGGYFKGAWTELRQVRWPTRRATWGLTGAVIAYSLFFVILVLLLDAGFKYLFELILKK